MTFSVLTAWGSSNNKVLPGRQSPFINTFVNSLTFVQAGSLWKIPKNLSVSSVYFAVGCSDVWVCTRLSHSHFYGRKTSQANSRSTIHTHRQADLWKSVSRILAIFCQNILMKKLSWAKSMFDWLVAVLFHKLCTCYLLTQPDHMHIFWSIILSALLKQLRVFVWDVGP